jgi:hypothetical protein
VRCTMPPWPTEGAGEPLVITATPRTGPKALEWATTANPSRRLSIRQEVAATMSALSDGWRERRERASLGLVGVPMAMIATGLTGLWWTWPLLLACSWGCTPSWGWSWMLALEEAFVGLQWAFVGTSALAQFPGSRLLVGTLWIAFPLALAGAGFLNRRRHARPEAYFPLR